MNCPAERIFDGVGSPGHIEDSEILYRGVFTPSGTNNSGTVTNGAVRTSDYVTGAISLWRHDFLPDHSDKGISQFIEKNVPAAPKSYLHRVVGIRAGAIRSLRLSDGRRIFCLLDDTAISLDDHHGAHATARSCMLRRREGLVLQSEDVAEMKKIFRHVLNEDHDVNIYVAPLKKK